MSMIKVENLTFSYDSSGDNVLDNVSFQIDTNWRLGFVGRNGRGKTTFLNLLLGKYEYSGKIISSVQFDYFPYEVKNKNRLTEDILIDICPAAEQWEIMRELSYLELDAEVLWRGFDTLSNGEQTKALLAALFLNEGHFLLIDEPTNHLDVKARELVAKYLKKKNGFILVSHDRRFLDSCVDHILSLNRADIEVQSGNFSSWKENFDRVSEFEMEQNKRLQKDIKRLKQAARQSSDWSDRVEAGKFGVQSSGLKADRGYVGHRAAKMMKRSKVIDERAKQAIDEKAGLLKNIENAENLKISPLKYHTNRLLSFSNVVVNYNGNAICKPISFDIEQGDRLVLNGKNGSGKSSILKLIVGENLVYTGDIQLGSRLIISYVPQDTSHLMGSLAEYARQNNLNESLFKAILRKMDFERNQFDKDMADFSGGQKKKVLIAKSLCEQAHLYVWDEPLNFIDIYSRMQIEQLINEFSPTMIFVEHDSAFRENVANRIINL